MADNIVYPTSRGPDVQILACIRGFTQLTSGCAQPYRIPSCGEVVCTIVFEGDVR